MSELYGIVFQNESDVQHWKYVSRKRGRNGKWVYQYAKNSSDKSKSKSSVNNSYKNIIDESLHQNGFVSSENKKYTYDDIKNISVQKVYSGTGDREKDSSYNYVVKVETNDYRTHTMETSGSTLEKVVNSNNAKIRTSNLKKNSGGSRR